MIDALIRRIANPIDDRGSARQNELEGQFCEEFCTHINRFLKREKDTFYYLEFSYTLYKTLSLGEKACTWGFEEPSLD